MSATTIGAPTASATAVSTRLRTDPAFQAFTLLRIGFTVAPILFGIDKFANVDGQLERLSGAVDQRHPARQRRPGDACHRRRRDHRRSVPSPCARATAPCSSPPGCGGIIFNLLTYSGFYDIALRDFGLMLGALTLARLATVYDR